MNFFPKKHPETLMKSMTCFGQNTAGIQSKSPLKSHIFTALLRAASLSFMLPTFKCAAVNTTHKGHIKINMWRLDNFTLIWVCKSKQLNKKCSDRGFT